MLDQRFGAQWRIRRLADFQRAYRRRVRASDETLVVCGCENGLDHPRLGLSVSRKVGTAVARNRWKRLLREAFRQSREHLPAGVDLVVIPRPGAEPELRRLQASLRELAGRVARRLARDRR
jgi:ribonuclease P protein component